MTGDETEADLLAIFKPPWRILRDGISGHYRIYDASGKVMCWIYVRQQGADYHLPDDKEARVLAQAIARLSHK